MYLSMRILDHLIVEGGFYDPQKAPASNLAPGCIGVMLVFGTPEAARAFCNREPTELELDNHLRIVG